MPRFQYRTIESSGREQTGSLIAETREEAEQRLIRDGLIVVSIEETADEQKPEPIALTNQDFDALGGSLANLASSALPLESGLRALAEEYPSRDVANKLRGLSDRLERGESLEAIVATNPAAAPPVLGNLLRTGLAPREIATVLTNYLSYVRESTMLRRRLWSGLSYSILLLIALVIVTLCIFLFIVPDFKELFLSYDTELPGWTVLIIDMSDFAIKFWKFGLVFLLLCLGGLWFFLKKSERATRSQMVKGIPLIGKVYQNESLATFCYVLADLMSRNLPLGASLKVAGACSRDGDLERCSQSMASQVDGGLSLREAARSQLQIPRRLLHIFGWAEQSEAFPDVLRGMGHSLSGKANLLAGLVTVLVEPIILLLIAVVISLTVIGLYLPLMKLLNDLT